MNFLAHAHLSGKDRDILLGNFIADSVKGKQIAIYPATVQRGIRFHRAIDHFTDTHSCVKQSVSLIQPYFHKYAPVVVDVYYDFFLSRDWHHYSQENLADFVWYVYKNMIRRFDQLPARSKYILPWMIAQNWMGSYGEYAELDHIFRRMAKRTRFRSNMEQAVPILQAHLTELQQHFDCFYPRLLQYCTQWLVDNPD
ncbi:MAG: ACP phosphodiesterase [Bacteroidales bacterium]|jgi:acyl carrier protein phosphodiesterase|nr:ACP phosphodiesterase [Bacteroidales bacterium]MDD3701317.1 ACP phosphodiesterase [Bacteroidales bacterium]MDY0370548.1 ACP phosphodiesterase [Bacteroidales bacterium]